MKYLLLISFAFLFETSFAQPAPRPNIVLVIADDITYNSFGNTGGPSWFQTPSIERIANEGVSFTNYFTTYSLCMPSRGSILTGLFPHSCGATDNFDPYRSDLPTIGSILSSAGYHTAYVGKYHGYHDPQPGWNYWFVCNGDYADAYYLNPWFDFNGVEKVVSGNVTQVITDTAHQIIASIDTPFLVCIGHQAPHQPALPETQYIGIYASEQMPIPPDFSRYTKAYPSFLYDNNPYTASELTSDLENYFETFLGIEDNISDIFDVLTSRNLLDNTILMFTGDNGYMLGQHNLKGKGLPYESSIRLPMFIRYPAWFSPNTVIVDDFGQHTDIAPTMCEAAGIIDTQYHFEGMSLHKLADGELHRDKVLVENIHLDGIIPDGTGKRPSMRTIRTSHYKYTYYACDHQTEDFFDLDADPNEDVNLINNPSYADLINQYRIMLDSLRIVLHDTISGDTVIRPCQLLGVSTRGNVILHNIFVQITPNLLNDIMRVTTISEESKEIEIAVYNEMGQLMTSQKTNSSTGFVSAEFDIRNLPHGVYMVRVIAGDERSSQFVLKE